MISVITYNVHYGRKLNDIISWLRQLPIPSDVINFQEFPYTKIEYVLSAFQGVKYTSTFAPAMIYKRKQFGEATFVNAEKLHIKAYKTVQLGSNYLEEKIFRSKVQRSSLLIRLEYKKRQFFLANTHLICFALDSHRRSQISQVLKSIEPVSKKESLPVVMLGDFNYSSIVRQKKLIEFMSLYNFTNAYRENTHKLFFLKHHQLDYVFSRDCTITHVHIEKLPFSDHYPVQFSLTLPN